MRGVVESHAAEYDSHPNTEYHALISGHLGGGNAMVSHHVASQLVLCALRRLNSRGILTAVGIWPRDESPSTIGGEPQQMVRQDTRAGAVPTRATGGQGPSGPGGHAAYRRRSSYSSLSTVEEDVHGPEKASNRLASVQAMRPATEKRDAAPPPDFTRYTM
jgi:hypothetical protein